RLQIRHPCIQSGIERCRRSSPHRPKGHRRSHPHLRPEGHRRPHADWNRLFRRPCRLSRRCRPFGPRIWMVIHQFEENIIEDSNCFDPLPYIMDCPCK
ncbi:unnamed protein product, partial [Nesidiocoris tenuis]